MVELKRVQSHNEVEAGDYLVHVEQDGQDTVTYKICDGNLVGTLLHLVQIHVTDLPATRIVLIEYISPLRQKRLKLVTLEK